MSQVYFIKLKNGENILGIADNDTRVSITLEDVLRVIQSPQPTKVPGEFINMNIPLLYNQFGTSSKITFDKADVLFYDIADPYYEVFYQTCFDALTKNEEAKKKYVMELYAGEDETPLEWDERDSEEPCVPVASTHKTVSELFDEYESDLARANADEDEEPNMVDGNNTLH